MDSGRWISFTMDWPIAIGCLRSGTDAAARCAAACAVRGRAPSRQRACACRPRGGGAQGHCSRRDDGPRCCPIAACHRWRHGRRARRGHGDPWTPQVLPCRRGCVAWRGAYGPRGQRGADIVHVAMRTPVPPNLPDGRLRARKRRASLRGACRRDLRRRSRCARAEHQQGCGIAGHPHGQLLSACRSPRRRYGGAWPRGRSRPARPASAPVPPARARH